MLATVSSNWVSLLAILFPFVFGALAGNHNQTVLRS